MITGLQASNVMVSPLSSSTQPERDPVQELVASWRATRPEKVSKLLRRAVGALHDLTDAAALTAAFAGRYNILQQMQPSKQDGALPEVHCLPAAVPCSAGTQLLHAALEADPLHQTQQSRS